MKFHIIYIVIVNDIEEDKKVFSRNNYDKYYDIGIKSFNDNKNMEDIINKLINLSDEDMNKVVEYIRCL